MLASSGSTFFRAQLERRRRRDKIADLFQKRGIRFLVERSLAILDMPGINLLVDLRTQVEQCPVARPELRDQPFQSRPELGFIHPGSRQRLGFHESHQ